MYYMYVCTCELQRSCIRAGKIENVMKDGKNPKIDYIYESSN